MSDEVDREGMAECSLFLAIDEEYRKRSACGLHIERSREVLL
jgi:hypothetical protein